MQSSRNEQFARKYKYGTKLKNIFSVALLLIMCLLLLSNYFYVTNNNKSSVDAIGPPLAGYTIYLWLPNPSEYGLEDSDFSYSQDSWYIDRIEQGYACTYWYDQISTITTTIPFDLLGEIYGRRFQLTYNGNIYDIDNPTVTFTNLSSVPFQYTLEDAGALAVSYTITYLDQGGSAFSGTLATNSPTKYPEGVGATLLAPTRDGYDFVGWYDNASCTGSPVTKISASDSGNKTFYAKWKVQTITITLNANLVGENYMIYVYKGNAICKQIYVDKGQYAFELDWVSDYNKDYRLAFVFGCYGNLTFATGSGVNANVTANNRVATILTLADTTISFTLANPRINSTIII